MRATGRPVAGQLDLLPGFDTSKELRELRLGLSNRDPHLHLPVGQHVGHLTRLSEPDLPDSEAG